MRRGTTEMDAELPVKLNEHEVAERAESMASKLVHIGTLRKKRREDLRSINALIETELDEVQRLARTIVDGVEARKQADLRFGDEVVPSQVEATEALAHVAEIVEPAKRWHRDGALCKADNCRKRIHYENADVLRTNGVVVEGDPLEPEQPAQISAQLCIGCGANITGLSAIERVKGVCEGCQMEGAHKRYVEVEQPTRFCSGCCGAVLEDAAAEVGLCDACQRAECEADEAEADEAEPPLEAGDR